MSKRVRIIVYEGCPAVLQKTFDNGNLPVNGVYKAPNITIRSSLLGELSTRAVSFSFWLVVKLSDVRNWFGRWV